MFSSSQRFSIKYAWYGDDKLITFDKRKHDAPLPISADLTPPSSAIVFSQYFSILEDIVRDQLPTILETFCSTPFDEQLEILIVAEKHGADYHPARVCLKQQDRIFQFVINLALSRQGLKRIERDFTNLRLLSESHKEDFLPSVYVFGEKQYGELTARYFCAEWLDRFHEFHPCDTDIYQIKLWDRSKGYRILGNDNVHALFRSASKILTYFYGFYDHKEIFPWHHAAGDFVIRSNDSHLEVKLITVRQYDQRIIPAQEITLPEYNAVALAYFFANMSLRMRLDRIDGVGDFCWSPTEYVTSIIEGFFDGLSAKLDENAFSRSDLLNALFELLNQNFLYWAEVFSETVQAYNPQAPDFTIIEQNLADHIWSISTGFAEVGRRFAEEISRK